MHQNLSSFRGCLGGIDRRKDRELRLIEVPLCQLSVPGGRYREVKGGNGLVQPRVAIRGEAEQTIGVTRPGTIGSSLLSNFSVEEEGIHQLASESEGRGVRVGERHCRVSGCNIINLNRRCHKGVCSRSVASIESERGTSHQAVLSFEKAGQALEVRLGFGDELAFSCDGEAWASVFREMTGDQSQFGAHSLCLVAILHKTGEPVDLCESVERVGESS
mmetsp:Transcript_40803/g.95343  ORF Transcript_40803/g.95343 Transcript_40803/m.95343 type:complete len:218 (-) Transcript_40803:301-954(-)